MFAVYAYFYTEQEHGFCSETIAFMVLTKRNSKERVLCGYPKTYDVQNKTLTDIRLVVQR